MTNPRVAPPVALADATYTTSTRSGGTGNCVAVGRVDGWVGIHDTKQGPDSTRRTTVALPAATFSTFLDAVKAGTLR
ncbi:MAG: DUF397 domain-containing protein [Pseudonocardiaceae bacterium]